MSAEQKLPLYMCLDCGYLSTSTEPEGCTFRGPSHAWSFISLEENRLRDDVRMLSERALAVLAACITEALADPKFPSTDRPGQKTFLKALLEEAGNRKWTMRKFAASFDLADSKGKR